MLATGGDQAARWYLARAWVELCSFSDPRSLVVVVHTGRMSTWGTGCGVPRHIAVRVYERDGGVCQLGYPGCSFYATECDHIVNIARLGVDRNSANDEDNLQAVCASCHAIKTKAETRAGTQARAAHRRARLKLPQQKHPGDW